ncbi:hypothetical protein CDD83_5341 [Cordyceps sp. RAO-2017]|nr:hypothetical protein CDD83_5341 [Cordyceps sp. RAO-2017]
MILLQALALAPLLAAHAAGGQAAAWQGPSKKWMEKHMRELEKHIKIDWNRPPTTRVFWTNEFTCPYYALSSLTTNFESVLELANRSTSRAAAKAPPPRYRIYPVIVPQGKPENNFTPNPISLTAEKAKTKIDSKASGWNAGAQLSVPFGSGGGSVGVSGGYHAEYTSGTTETDSAGIHWECPPGYRCEVQSWTLHLEATSICVRKPAITGTKRLDPCLVKRLECDQYRQFALRECATVDGRVAGHRLEPCTVRAPLVNLDGTPVTENVYIMADLADPAGPIVLRVLGDWLKLDNGRLYNQASRKFKNSGAGDEYADEAAARPRIPAGARVVRVEGADMLLDNGTWIDQLSGETWLDQPPDVVGYRSGGWLELGNGQFYKPETDQFWSDDKGKPYRSARLTRPGIPKGSVARGFADGWVKLKGGKWINPEFGKTLSNKAWRQLGIPFDHKHAGGSGRGSRAGGGGGEARRYDEDGADDGEAGGRGHDRDYAYGYSYRSLGADEDEGDSYDRDRHRYRYAYGDEDRDGGYDGQGDVGRAQYLRADYEDDYEVRNGDESQDDDPYAADRGHDDDPWDGDEGQVDGHEDWHVGDEEYDSRNRYDGRNAYDDRFSNSRGTSGHDQPDSAREWWHSHDDAHRPASAYTNHARSDDDAQPYDGDGWPARRSKRGAGNDEPGPVEEALAEDYVYGGDEEAYPKRGSDGSDEGVGRDDDGYGYGYEGEGGGEDGRYLRDDGGYEDEDEAVDDGQGRDDDGYGYGYEGEGGGEDGRYLRDDGGYEGEDEAVDDGQGGGDDAGTPRSIGAEDSGPLPRGGGRQAAVPPSRADAVPTNGTVHRARPGGARNGGA